MENALESHSTVLNYNLNIKTALHHTCYIFPKYTSFMILLGASVVQCVSRWREPV